MRFNTIFETPSEAAERLGQPAASINKADRDVKFLTPRYFTVFNLKTQTEGLDDHIPAFTIDQLPDVAPIKSAQSIWEAFTDQPRVTPSSDGSASYFQGADFIQMPPEASFDPIEEYYSTLFHEGAHSTGHPKRLNRKLGVKGTKEYMVEELVAEITAAMLCGAAGIETKVLENSAGYIKGWMNNLKDSPDVLFAAMTQAERAADYMQKIGSFSDDTVTT